MLEAGASALEGIISSRHYSNPFLFKRLGLAYSKLSDYDSAYILPSAFQPVLYSRRNKK